MDEIGPRVPARRGGRRGDRSAGCELRSRRLRVRRLDLGRPGALAPRGGSAAAARRRLVFMCVSTLLFLCSAGDDDPVGGRARPPQFGLGRFEWEDEQASSSICPTASGSACLRANGFELEDLIEIQAPAGAETHPYYSYVPPEWGAHAGRPRRSGWPESPRDHARSSPRPRRSGGRSSTQLAHPVRGRRARLRGVAGRRSGRTRRREGPFGRRRDRPRARCRHDRRLPGRGARKAAGRRRRRADARVALGLARTRSSPALPEHRGWEEVTARRRV